MEEKIVQTVKVTWPKWPPCLFKVKTFKTLLHWNQCIDCLEIWNVALDTEAIPNNDLGLTLGYFTAMYVHMISLNFDLFTQVSDSGSRGHLVFIFSAQTVLKFLF